MKNVGLKNPLDLHALWRKEMVINTILLVLVLYFFKIHTLNHAAVTCLVAGCGMYILFWFDKRKLDNPDKVEELGKETIKISAVKTLLSSLSWFMLSAILYLMSILHIAILLKHLGKL
jgi:uncharacterized membrane protein YbhN (UPF0104 family)